jgi:hypothetical protein
VLDIDDRIFKQQQNHAVQAFNCPMTMTPILYHYKGKLPNTNRINKNCPTKAHFSIIGNWVQN